MLDPSSAVTTAVTVRSAFVSVRVNVCRDVLEAYSVCISVEVQVILLAVLIITCMVPIVVGVIT